MNLEEIRNQIDLVDDEIATLFNKRMNLVEQVIEAKKKDGKAVNDKNREKDIILRVCNKVDEDKALYLKKVFETLFEVSKSYQSTSIVEKSKVSDKIEKALEKGFLKFPTRATVACQGVQGAYSGIATERFFPLPSISYFKNFDGVFSAVEKGLCKYGVLPIENSYAGSVNQVYDLMKEHKFYIVKSLRLPVSHNLVVNKETELKDIKEIFSHEQAIAQCRKYLAKFPLVKVTAVQTRQRLLKWLLKVEGKTLLQYAQESAQAFTT